MGGYKETDIAIRQLLRSEYGLYGACASQLRSDAKGILGLRAACKQLAEHDARQWMQDMVFCIVEVRELVRTEVMELMYDNCVGDWDESEYYVRCWYSFFTESPKEPRTTGWRILTRKIEAP